MKKLWIAFTVLAMVVLTLLLIPTISSDATIADFQIEGSTLIRYTGTASAVSVPATVEIIGRSAFEGNTKVKKVSIPDQVKSIESFAFWGCTNLEKVTLGSGIEEIQDFTFTACEKLEHITLPEELKRIGIMAFADCISLKHVKIPVSVMDIHETAFDGIENLTIHAEEYSYPYKYALERGQNTSNMPVPTKEPEIISEENKGNTVPEVTPEPVIPYNGNVLSSTTIVGNNALFLMDREEMLPMEGNTIETDAFVTQTTQINDWQYYGDKSLVEITPSEGIEEIGRFSFARSNISRIVLPKGVREIQYAAFYHCDELEEVEIPITVNKIEAKAFAFTPWMQEFLEGKTHKGSDFLVVGDGILLAYRGNKSTVTIPEGVKYIASEAFLNHKEIENVEFPETLIRIEDEAFMGCNFKPAD